MSTTTNRKRRWFLPETPDVLAMLHKQAEITARGIDAFAEWAGGATARAEDVRDAEHDCDEVRRDLVDTVRQAFTTPMQPEDLFQLSCDLDRVINGAKNTVREAETMGFPPDRASAEMAGLLAEGVHHLVMAIEALSGVRGLSATKTADAAVKSQRDLERVYRAAAGELLEISDFHVVVARREFYRRISAISDDIVAVADRIWYSRVKES